MKTRTCVVFALVLAGVYTRAIAQAIPEPDPQDASVTEFLQHVRTYSTELPTLSADEAAARWLTLVDLEAALLRRGIYAVQPLGTDPLMGALPPPTAWEALSRSIDARTQGEVGDRRALSLKLLGCLLTGNTEYIRSHADQINLLLGQQNRITALAGRGRTVVDVLLGESRPPVDEVEEFTQRIEFGRGPLLRVPDLVTLAGDAKAEEILRRAIRSGSNLQVPYGAATRKLAQRIALELAAEMPSPQWMLVTPDSPELFEAMEQRFGAPPLVPLDNIGPADPLPGSEFDEAAQMHLLGLLQSGTTDDALRILLSIQGTRRPGINSLSAAGRRAVERTARAPGMYPTLRKMLEQNPQLSLWALYRDAAIHSNHLDEMIVHGKQVATSPTLPAQILRGLRTRLAEALFTADRVEEAIPYIETMIADRGSRTEARIAFAHMLARAGSLLDHPEWAQNGLAQAVQLLNTLPNERDSYDRPRWLIAIADALATSGRSEQAMELLGKEIARLSNPNVAGEQSGHELTIQQLSIVSANIAHRAGRHADVISALERSPWWNVPDLSYLLTRREHYDTPLGVIAADSLFHVGRVDEARTVLHALLDAWNSDDQAYALLLKIDGDAALARLDQLRARDRFEDRPLIWRATLLVQQGKLDEAELSIREAISIDPSDGEQPRGDRMRAYAVLSDILAAKGNAKEAEFYGNVVKAIRMAEDADRFASAGLTTRAVRIYEESLKLFADAYCIQSRLALRLMDLGLTEQAREHYRRAFELMPDSFGRVESHCFGCEGIFAGPMAGQVAEEVLARLAKEDPQNARVQYLLGHLRQAQGHYSLALDAFRRAAKIDPDYLNAWRRIVELREYVQLSASERDAAALAILRLDPLARHAAADLGGVRSMKELWQAAETAAALRTPRSQTVFRLAGAADRDDARPLAAIGDAGSASSPARTLSRTDAIRVVRLGMTQP